MLKGETCSRLEKSDTSFKMFILFFLDNLFIVVFNVLEQL